MSTGAVVALGFLALAAAVQMIALLVVAAQLLRAWSDLRRLGRTAAPQARAVANDLAASCAHVADMSRVVRASGVKLKGELESARVDVAAGTNELAAGVRGATSALWRLGTIARALGEGLETYHAHPRRRRHVNEAVGQTLEAYRSARRRTSPGAGLPR
jgi:hypothetical protein